MSDDKNPLEQAVDQAMDTFVYAPIGLLFDGPALFPKLVEKGRTQVQVARMMGQMAVQMGQGEANKRVGKAQSQVRDSLVAVGLVPAPATPPAAEPDVAAEATTTTGTADKTAATTPPAKKTAAKKTPARKPAAKKTPTKKTTAKKGPARATAAKNAAASALSIPDYDSLSASQVVSRLRGLASSDLDALKAYEASTRARKTILNRITQLQKG